LGDHTKGLRSTTFCLTDREGVEWCRHSIPNLKKAQLKPKTKNTPDKKKSGDTGKVSKQAKKPSKGGAGGNKDNKEVLAEILSLLRKLI
ncbi:hypothetical protein RhiirA4_486637, partial [Rhizophagus irregularis]